MSFSTLAMLSVVLYSPLTLARGKMLRKFAVVYSPPLGATSVQLRDSKALAQETNIAV